MEKREAAEKLGTWLKTQNIENYTIGELMEEGYVEMTLQGGFDITQSGAELLKVFDPAWYKRFYVNPKMSKSRKTNGAHVIMSGDRFVWTGGYHTREVPKRAGFQWDTECKRWWTVDPVVARQLFDFADYDAKVEMGSPTVPEGIGKYKEVVLEGLRYLADRCDYAYKLDCMGYSKTDTHLGHSLAAKFELTPEQAALGIPMLSIHRRQLPEHVRKAVEPFFEVAKENLERRETNR